MVRTNNWARVREADCDSRLGEWRKHELAVLNRTGVLEGDPIWARALTRAWMCA